MHWTIDEIRSFLDVIEAGSMSAAAARANLSKSVISKRISDLEVTLGAALFQRHAGRITPTETGLELAARLRPLLAEMTTALEGAAWGMAGLRGKLSIAAPMSFGIRHLGPVIADFARQHPDLELVIEYDDRMVDPVREGHDVAIRIGMLGDSALIARRLCEDPRVLCASPAYLARYGTPRTPQALNGHRALGYQNLANGQLWRFEQPDAPPFTPALESHISANNGDALRDLAIAGLGLALLPLFLVHEALSDGRLVAIDGAFSAPPLPISVLWPPLKPLPRKTRAFVDHLAQALGPVPPWHGATPEKAAAPSAPPDEAP